MRHRATHRAATDEPPAPPKVVVTDVDTPFGSIVGFMVKWAIASIPAMLILLVIGFIIAAVLAALGMGLRQ